MAEIQGCQQDILFQAYSPQLIISANLKINYCKLFLRKPLDASHISTLRYTREAFKEA